VTTQAEIVGDLLAAAGYSVISVSHALNRWARFFDILQTIARQGRNIDLMLLNVFGGPSFVIEDGASCIARLQRVPVIMFLHGGAMPEFMARHPHWSRRVLSRAELLLAPSPYLARAVEQLGFRAQVVPNVIELEDYPCRRRRQLEPRLLWMRTFHDQYNPMLAVRVLQQVRREYPTATLVMGGEDKGSLAMVRSQVEQLGLAGTVEFRGFLDHRAKLQAAAECDIFLNTNRVDNMPVSVVEACAFGMPVVATSVGGLPDLLTHERNGLLVPDDDEPAMTRSVLRLLSDPALAERISTGARSLAERSSWRAVLPQWQRVIGTVAMWRAGGAN
jgi:glycosyltransferase involved in cell wall biosynthesis